MKQLSLVELFHQFIRLRKSGKNRDDAWYEIVKQSAHLTENDTKRLLAVARDWERREGLQYQYPDKNGNGKQDTIIKRISPLSEELRKEPVKAGLTGELNPQRLREMEKKKLEAALDALDNRSPEAKAPVTSPIKPQTEPPHEPTYFTRNTMLLMYFRGFPQPLEISFRTSPEQVIGRAVEGSALLPDIDLSVVNAQDFGVSRMHAALLAQDNKLFMTDLGSVNETYINGQRLFPQEIRALKDHDEIWFAQLPCRVRFWHV